MFTGLEYRACLIGPVWNFQSFMNTLFAEIAPVIQHSAHIFRTYVVPGTVLGRSWEYGSDPDVVPVWT